MYPSVPLLLATAGNLKFPAYRVATELPADLQSEVVIQVERIGGPMVTPTLDAATVDVDVWAPDKATAETVAQAARVWLLHELPGQSVSTAAGTATVARTRELSGPSRRPTADPDLRRVGMTFQVTTHSH